MTNDQLRKEFEEKFGTVFSSFTFYNQFFDWFLAKRKEEIGDINKKIEALPIFDNIQGEWYLREEVINLLKEYE
jgi:hypothetical protein